MVFQGTPIEYMALILIIVSFAKIMSILINPRFWYEKIVKTVWKNPVLVLITSLLVSGISLYFLLQELTIVQILAAMFFLVFLMTAGFSLFPNHLLQLKEKLYHDKNVIKRSWIYILIWLALLIYGLIYMFL